MTADRALALRRLLAFAADVLLIAAWGGLLFGGVMLATGGNPPRTLDPWKAQLVGLLVMTGPVTLAFALCERSSWRASPGKRLLGLAVTDESGGRLAFGAALLRNAAKFVPWELGHAVAQQAVLSGEGGLAAWVWGPAVLSFAGPMWWLLTLFRSGRTPYDRWAAARVGYRAPR